MREERLAPVGWFEPGAGAVDVDGTEVTFIFILFWAGTGARCALFGGG
jgi:hypothetical protein